MVKVIGVKFKDTGKAYYFDPGDLRPHVGEAVIVETARGLEYGKVSIALTEVKEEEIVSPLKQIVRIATKKDELQLAENKKKEKEAFSICEQKIEKHKLDMKLVDVEYTFDANKILFYFTSEGRVDFRELVKDLASVFRTRIELRQIGIRDEAKMLGGLGICGRGLCCSGFLDGFHPVSIKMAKEQGLSLNPTKISGTCGRLMCCLKYEQNCYEEFSKMMPSVGAVVVTPKGKGIVQSTVAFSGLARVKLEDETEAQIEEFSVKDIKILKNIKANESTDVDMKELKRLEEN